MPRGAPCGRRYLCVEVGKHLGKLVLVCVLTWCAPGTAHAVARAQIVDGPAAETTATDATMRFEATEPAALAFFECRIDGSAWSTCTSPVTFPGLGGGPHEFAVRMSGLLVDSQPAVRAWTIVRQTVTQPPPLLPGAHPSVPKHAPKRDRFTAHGCRWALARPGQASILRLERAAICLVNYERRRRGLSALRRSPLLTAAARRYARTMVSHRFFAHTTPRGTTFARRFAGSGYPRTGPWRAGEVLAWVAPDPTPLREVRALMNSGSHRRVMLDPSWRDVGFGVAAGAPRGRVRGAGTYVGQFATRS